MKLIEMRCPNCDAPLSVNADRDEAFCHHCNTMFLIEDAPSAKSLNSSDSVWESASNQPNPKEAPAEATVQFEKAKSELPMTKRFAGAIAARVRTKAAARSARKESKSAVPRRTATTEETVAPNEPPERRVERRSIVILIAVAVVLFVVIMVLAGTCSTHGSNSGASSGVNEASSHAVSSGASGAGAGSSSSASSSSSTPEENETPSVSTAATQASSESSPSAQDSTSTVEDGFPCNLDDTATFSGVTIPVDSTWKDYSPVWDLRRRTSSYTAGSTALGDVEISISTFTGGDTKNAIALMKDYGDSPPISLGYGEYKVMSEDVRDGVTYTRIEGVDSQYESLFSYNPVSKHGTIREMHANDVVRCVCLVGYAENGTGFVVAVALCGSADDDECLYSASKILDGVTFVPSECNTDSVDSWLYEVSH